MSRVFLLALLCVACATPPTPAASAPVARGAGTGTSRLIQAAATEGALGLTVTSPVRRGGLATATVSALPGSECGISVGYRSGDSEAKGLTSTRVDATGTLSWRWVVGPNTTPGRWPVEVHCVAPDGSSGAAREGLSVE